MNQPPTKPTLPTGLILGVLAACSSSAGPNMPQGPGAGSGGTLPTSFTVFTSDRTLAGVHEPWLASPDGTELRSLAAGLPAGGSIDDVGARLSSDGKHFAAVIENGGQRQYAVLDVATGDAIVLPYQDGASGPLSSFTFSPDSSRLLLTRRDSATGQRRVFLMNGDGSSPLELNLGGDAAAGWWSPSSSHFVCFVDPGGTLEKSFYLVGADGAVALDLMPTAGSDRGAFSPSWSADGSVLTFKTNTHFPSGEVDQVWAYTVAGGVVLPMSPAEDRTSAAGASASGAWVAYTASPFFPTQRLLYITSVASGAQVLVSGVPASQDASLSSPRWSPPGANVERIAYLSDQADSATFELYVADTLGASTRLHPPLPSDQRVQSYEWSPDGRFITYVVQQQSPLRRDLYVVDVESGSAPTLLTNSADYEGVASTAWSPNSQWLYASQFEAASQDLVVRSFPAGDWSNSQTLGRGGIGTIVFAYDQVVSHALSPTPDSTGIVWHYRPQGQLETEVRYGRPNDPAATLTLSAPASSLAHGTVHQTFVR